LTATAAYEQTATASALTATAQGEQTATAAAWTRTPTPTPDSTGQAIYLPLVLRLIPVASLTESEPNNLFEEADAVAALPVTIQGRHDGAAGTGDVYLLDDNLLTASEVVQATIDTANAAGLQLVVYDPAGEEIARAYEGAFVVSFIVPASGTYYVYVYTDPGANNTAAYELLIVILP
jgi:hypothetical protein